MNNSNTAKRLSLRSNSHLTKCAVIAVLSALAAVVMIFEIPLPFAPTFYKLDFSEVIIMIGGFAYGPLAAAVMELIKVVVNTVITSTYSGYVGELANFIVGCALTVPAAAIYKYAKHTKVTMVISMLVGTVIMSVVAAFVNYYILIPAFAQFTPIEKIIELGTKINRSITDKKTLVIFATVPFNAFKGIVATAITVVIYPNIRRIFKDLPEDKKAES